MSTMIPFSQRGFDYVREIITTGRSKDFYVSEEALAGLNDEKAKYDRALFLLKETVKRIQSGSFYNVRKIAKESNWSDDGHYFQMIYRDKDDLNYYSKNLKVNAQGWQVIKPDGTPDGPYPLSFSEIVHWYVIKDRKQLNPIPQPKETKEFAQEIEQLKASGKYIENAVPDDILKEFQNPGVERGDHRLIKDPEGGFLLYIKGVSSRLRIEITKEGFSARGGYLESALTPIIKALIEDNKYQFLQSEINEVSPYKNRSDPQVSKDELLKPGIAIGTTEIIRSADGVDFLILVKMGSEQIDEVPLKYDMQVKKWIAQTKDSTLEHPKLKDLMDLLRGKWAKEAKPLAESRYVGRVVEPNDALHFQHKPLEHKPLVSPAIAQNTSNPLDHLYYLLALNQVPFNKAELKRTIKDYLQIMLGSNKEENFEALSRVKKELESQGSKDLGKLEIIDELIKLNEQHEAFRKMMQNEGPSPS